MPAMPSVADEGTLGARQLSVLEALRVDLEVQCLNKRLIAATVTIDKQQYPLESREASGQEAGRHWTLAVAKTPLARIDSALKYEIQVTDEDELHLPHPIEGFIRIKVDRPPTIFAAVDVQYFLPTTGMPEITYTVNDDYGISRVQLYAEVIHAPPVSTGAVGSVVSDVAHPPPMWRPPRWRLQRQPKRHRTPGILRASLPERISSARFLCSISNPKTRSCGENFRIMASIIWPSTGSNWSREISFVSRSKRSTTGVTCPVSRRAASRCC